MRELKSKVTPGRLARLLGKLGVTAWAAENATKKNVIVLEIASRREIDASVPWSDRQLTFLAEAAVLDTLIALKIERT
jgi:hypothetical protein